MLSDELQEKIAKKIEGRLVEKGREKISGTIVEVGYRDYVNTISIIEDLYHQTKVVHANFSEHNIFKTKKGLIVFDSDTAVDMRRPNAIEFLETDIKNITRFFVKKGLTVENLIDILKRIIV